MHRPLVHVPVKRKVDEFFVPKLEDSEIEDLCKDRLLSPLLKKKVQEKKKRREKKNRNKKEKHKSGTAEGEEGVGGARHRHCIQPRTGLK